MPDNTYSDRELDAKFSQHEVLDEEREKRGVEREAVLRRELLDKDQGILPRIELQTIKTNGRVRWLEKMIWLAMGGLGVITILVIPIALALLKSGKV